MPSSSPLSHDNNPAFSTRRKTPLVTSILRERVKSLEKANRRLLRDRTVLQHCVATLEMTSTQLLDERDLLLVKLRRDAQPSTQIPEAFLALATSQQSPLPLSEWKRDLRDLIPGILELASDLKTHAALRDDDVAARGLRCTQFAVAVETMQSVMQSVVNRPFRAVHVIDMLATCDMMIPYVYLWKWLAEQTATTDASVVARLLLRLKSLLIQWMPRV